MVFTLSTTTAPARELGLLLRKHPDRVQTFELGFGNVHVFYPEATDERCTAALLLDVDPVALIRGRSGAAADQAGLPDAYVNDRPYAVSSFMSVAIARVLGSALGGKIDERVDVTRVRSFEATVEPIRTNRDGLAARLFEPLGYAVETTTVGELPSESHHYERLTIRARTTLQGLLTHLYVLIPVIDNRKHYWVSDDELDKLFRFGGAWLAAHPERELITRRYLRRAPTLARAAVAKLAALDDIGRDPAAETDAGDGEALIERPLRLQERRIAAVIDVLRESGARSVLDLGCGNGDLLAALVRESTVERIGGSDVSPRELERARARLEHMPMAQSRRDAIALFGASIVYADRRLREYDAVALLEVIEHLDPFRIASFEQAVFGFARPRLVLMTTPNCEYNVLFPNLAAGTFRHADHRFEWTRDEFAAWSDAAAERYGYSVERAPVGDAHATLGAPTQIAVFRCN
jgi:3' terminal RNA ribose 2'-O-methyltransferase Hen1